jgi:glucosamine--fructose-6-phosphate aminotransferase (isomerizing)
MKEMSLSSAEAYHFLEFRHGPMSLVDRDHLIVGLLSEELRDFELAVLRDLKARGGRILAIAPTDDGLAGLADDALVLGQAVSEAARPVLYLPLLQLLAYHRALGRKLNPDRPRNVVMAIRLDGAEMV